MLSTDEFFSIKIDHKVIKNSNNKKLLGINLNNRLGFDTHVTIICNRVSKKLHASARILRFMNIHKRRMKMKDLIISEFGYCLLVSMFQSRKFTELLQKDNSTTLGNRNIQLLATELFKVKNWLLPPFRNEIFVEMARHYYDLRKKTEFERNNVKTMYNRTVTVIFLGPKTWELCQTRLKKVTALRNLH